MTSSRSYDIAVLSDLRFPGGTSSAIAEEVRAGAAAGYRTALVALEAPNLTYPFAFNPRIRELIDAGCVDLHFPDDPIEARLAAVHNPYVLKHMPLRAPAVRAEERLLVVHHPPAAADGEPFYDVASVHRHAEETLHGDVLWAPVGPLVRAQLEGHPDGVPLLGADWYNIVDPGRWSTERRDFCRDRPVIGRHSRPDRRKWPDTREEILTAYPADRRFVVRILGAAPFLVETLGAYPRNWEVLRFAKLPAPDFLRSIDFFVYFHHSRWVEAFGCTIAEAMASGAVAVLPPHFEVLFEDAAVYVSPAEVSERVLALRSNYGAFREQAERGRDAVERRFSPAAHVARVRRLIGPPRVAQSIVPRDLPASGPTLRRPGGSDQRILFLSSNGVGLGHLTRLLAIARRCGERFQPVFVTMSQGVSVVEDLGYVVEYLPFHDYAGCEVYRWNKYLRKELNGMILFFDARVVVADFNSPFQGVLDTISDNPDTWFVWCRRGMWQAGSGAKFVERERHFHAVLEPRDLADGFDVGLTTRHRSRTRQVPPIRLLDDHELLPRDLARRELGLDPDKITVLVMLGSGNNYDYNVVRQLALSHLAGRGDVQIAVAHWLISERAVDLPADVVRLEQFPLARWFNAFDAAISAVGYNSFHELIFAGLPTVFVPNENPRQDDQLARARYAERNGLGYCVRTHDIYGLKPRLDRLLDADERDAIRRNCGALDHTNGASAAARMIEELAYTARGDRRYAVDA